MLKVSILGANSFIGKHLISLLAARQDVVLTVFGKSFEPSFEDKFSCVEGDFAKPESLRKALIGQDIVYHFISQTIPSTSWDTPLSEIEENLKPFLGFIELAKENGVKKICFASSGGTIYGLQQDLLTEEHKTEPFSPYGIIKRTIESFLHYAKVKDGINYDIYRISNVYGEGQDIGKGLGFINTALENIVNKRPVSIYGNGKNARDYLCVQDAAKLLTLSLKKNLSDSDIYNVNSNNPINLIDLVSLIRNVTGCDFEVKYLASRASDNQKVVLDNTKIMQHFPEMQLISLADGIRNTFDYLKECQSIRKKQVLVRRHI